MPTRNRASERPTVTPTSASNIIVRSAASWARTKSLPDVVGRLPGRREAGDPTTCRVERDDAAQGGGASQRAGRIRAVRDRHGARRDCRGRSAARSAHGPHEVPRVASGSEAGRLCRDPARQRGARRLPDDRVPELLEPRGEGGRHRRATVDVAERCNTDVVGCAGDLLPRVLEQHRHTRRCAVVQRRHEEAERRVEGLARGDARVVRALWLSPPYARATPIARPRLNQARSLTAEVGRCAAARRCSRRATRLRATRGLGADLPG